jgi:hypothetical protein
MEPVKSLGDLGGAKRVTAQAGHAQPHATWQIRDHFKARSRIQIWSA